VQCFFIVEDKLIDHEDATAAHAAGDRYLPLTFSHAGGISITFSRLLERTFICAPTHAARWRYGCPPVFMYMLHFDSH
jgi:hypothetical protein